MRRPTLVLLASLAVACAPDELVGPGCHHGVLLVDEADLEGAWTYRAFEIVDEGGELVPGARTADIPVEVALGESWLDIRALDALCSRCCASKGTSTSSTAARAVGA